MLAPSLMPIQIPFDEELVIGVLDMAIVHERSEQKNWFVRFGTTDFCPWANKFVYWLKEPIGWFVLATATCCMIGAYFSPIGWTLASSLVAIIIVGMLWPLVAIHAVRVELRPEKETVHEGEACRMIVGTCNRIPLPVWGLTVEGYLDVPADQQSDEAPLPTVGLASVPPLCNADYSISIQPSLRGHYPQVQPEISCSFPFGIWTAKKPLHQENSLTVWPKIYRIEGTANFPGRTKSDDGTGSRPGQEGDFIGVREYRRGDSSKHVNWIASAKAGKLIVTERSAPQTAIVNIALDIAMGAGGREELSRRVRTAASIFSSLHNDKIPTCVKIGNRSIHVARGFDGFREVMNAMADVSAEGGPEANFSIPKSEASLVVTSSSRSSGMNGVSTIVEMSNPGSSHRSVGHAGKVVISRVDNLDDAIARIWQEIKGVSHAA